MIYINFGIFRSVRMILLSCALLFGFAASRAAIIRPIVWSVSVDMESATAGTVKVKAGVQDGWHLYGTDVDPEAGPRPTAIDFIATPDVRFIGDLTADVPPVTAYDEVFQAQLSWWGSDVVFSREFVVMGNESDYAIDVAVSFQGCNDSECLAPAKESFMIRNGAVVDESVSVASGGNDLPLSDNMFDPGQNRWWQPVEAVGAAQDISDSPWWYIFAWGFLSGLLALLTPCVWPLIPMTMSFFLKKGKPRGEAIRDALLYGVSIVVIYLALGLVITGIYGAGKLNELSTNAVFNMLFFALLVLFGISFLGAFDIKLPSRWSNAIDSRAEHTTGYLSIFFMAFTLALVSFSCTGPLIGTLLVEAASLGDRTGPAIGMGAFALALAIPFTLFAIFPSWLKEMPRSGGWLNSVKVVLGFLELALSLKFLSVADMAYGWHILDREVFLALWIVIFVMLGMYLLGKIVFSHDSPADRVGLGRFFLALVSWSFAVYLLPGLWGAPLKGVSAFVPPLTTQDFNLYSTEQWQHSYDYDEGMRMAAADKRPVLIDFSGYGCVNCRKMEGAVFDTDRISSLIGDRFVLITLMVDDKRKLPQPIDVMENDRKVTLETVGDKWSYLQRYKFKANSQPYYIVLDNNGDALVQSRGYNEDVQAFAEWLESALENYR